LKFFNKKIFQHINNYSTSLQNVLDAIETIDRKKTTILLFHAASAGEFEQLKPILSKINREKYYIVQSFTSPTIFNKECNNNLFDICCYHPLDFFWKSYYFFKKINPQAYIVTRHDIWPNHLFVTKILNIKSFYINANLHKNSIWIKSYYKFLSRIIFKNLSFCLVPSEGINNKCMDIIHKDKIHTTGDSRFDQVLERKSLNNSILLPYEFMKSKNIIFGSYDDIDEALIIDSLHQMYPNGDSDLLIKNHRLILVPHEICENKITNLINKLNNMNFNVVRFSELDKNKIKRILLVDHVGILADLYKYAKLAYIGAGFSGGVHSVIEPGVYDCIVSFGPNIELLEEAKYIYNHKIGFMIKNKKDLINFITLLNNTDDLDEQRLKFNEYISSQKNASLRIIDFIESKI
jgi:3-deoxy-D-manno-octulosonic-acid transferase